MAIRKTRSDRSPKPELRCYPGHGLNFVRPRPSRRKQIESERPRQYRCRSFRERPRVQPAAAFHRFWATTTPAAAPKIAAAASTYVDCRWGERSPPSMRGASDEGAYRLPSLRSIRLARRKYISAKRPKLRAIIFGARIWANLVAKETDPTRVKARGDRAMSMIAAATCRASRSGGGALIFRPT